MRVLWLCNQEPPAVAAARRKAGSNKEGWIAGCMNAVLAHREQDGITLAVAFPIRQDENLHGHTDEFEYYGFTEDTNHPEDYDPGLTAALGLICEEFRPDVIHIFGTEYPHCLAMLRVQEWKKRAIVHLQGLMEHCAADYFGGLPEEVTSKASFRDILRRDSLRQQKENAAKIALNDLEFQVANVLNEEARKIQEEINWRKKNGQKTV